MVGSNKETDCTAAKPGGDTEFDWHVKRPAASDGRWQADLEEEYKHPSHALNIRPCGRTVDDFGPILTPTLQRFGRAEVLSIVKQECRD